MPVRVMGFASVRRYFCSPTWLLYLQTRTRLEVSSHTPLPVPTLPYCRPSCLFSLKAFHCEPALTGLVSRHRMSEHVEGSHDHVNLPYDYASCLDPRGVGVLHAALICVCFSLSQHSVLPNSLPTPARQSVVVAPPLLSRLLPLSATFFKFMLNIDLNNKQIALFCLKFTRFYCQLGPEGSDLNSTIM